MNSLSAWIMQYAKGAPHLLNPVWFFLFSGKKKEPQRKAAGDIPSPLKFFFYHSSLFEVLSVLWTFSLSIIL